MQDGAQISTQKPSQRSAGIDLLRIVAMLLIILHHLSVHTPWAFDGGLVKDTIITLAGIGGKLGVDCFVLITGYNMIEKRFKSRAFIRIWTQAYFYSVVIFLIFTCTGWLAFDPGYLKFAFAPVISGEYWFVTTYIGLYLLIPILNRALSNLALKQYSIIVCIGFIMFSVIPTITTLGTWSSNLMWFCFLYAVGGFMKRCVASNTGAANASTTNSDIASNNPAKGISSFINPVGLVQHIKPTLAIIISLIVICISTAYIRYSGILGGDARYLHSQHSIFIVYIAIALMLIFTKLNPKGAKFITKVGIATFGVYLIHDNWIIRKWMWSAFAPLYDMNIALLIVLGLLGCVAIFAVCTLIELLREVAIEKPFMKFIDRTFGKTLDKIDAIMRL